MIPVCRCFAQNYLFSRVINFETIIACPKLLFPSHLGDFNKNTHTSERSTIEIDKKKYIADIFTKFQNSRKRKQIFYGDFLR